ncbi:hypothetical protein ACLOJK_036226 [Asimina triloba]
MAEPCKSFSWCGVWGVDKELLQKLISSLSAIQAVLQDAEEQQFRSNAVRDWLQKLKYVAYEAEDLVDEIVTEAQQSKATESGNEAAAGKKKGKWQEYLDSVSSVFDNKKQVMASRITEINAQLEQIAKERRDFHLETGHGGKQLEIIPRQPVSSVRDESSQVLGRIDDTKRIISFLLSDDSDKRKFSVIAIVGMGGVGKTTLAQVVYNDESVTDNFELRAWVCVSEDFDVKRLTKEIITSISKSSCDLSDIDSLQCSLRDKLHVKKFLLVLDDVWSENGSDWEQLRAPFTFGAKGSKIVVTTRSQEVSNAMQAATTHNLKCLSERDCWSVFVNQAFNDGNANAYPELIKIGEELVKKCGGLPLAAKALGGLLSSKRQAKEWENILKSPIWSWGGPASNILPALRLSYQYLPAHLKRCFTFCSVFPKDYVFLGERQLILLWVAHGFIRPEEEKQIEDTASEYFNDLLLRSFFQLSRDSGSTRYYKMHDLVHDLAQFMSSDECIQLERGKSRGVHGKTQHLSYSASYGELINFESFYESKGLRTFLLMTAIGRTVSQKVPHDMFERFRCIRVLDLSSRYNITELPNPIGNLKHLRYLNLSETRIKELPESICSIYNLQTSLLRWCTNLVRLPNEMRKLTNMLHLDLDGCSNIESMPPQIGRLTFLQTLPWFVVGRERERGIAELKELTDLRGKLVIKKLENVTEAVDAELANLTNKPFIDHLSLEWSTGRSWSTQEEELVEGLRPHRSLKKLELDGYMGTHFPSWMHTCLSNLTAFHLRNCRRCSILPPLGRLPSLSYLEIKGMDQVEQMGAEMGGGFPSLKEFRLCDMVKLEKWQVESGEVGVLLCLQSLHISNCPQLQKIQIPCSNLTKLSIADCARLVSLPRLPSLEGLKLTNLNNLEEWCDVVGGEAHFPHLKSLKIDRCPKMRRWPGILPALTELRISNCEGFNELPRLPSLEGLELTNLDNLEEWCDVVGGEAHFPRLKSIYIDDCPKMRRWPGILPALTELRISNCEGFNELPRLPSLEGLELTNLDNLEEWYDVVGGEAHFPLLKSLNIDRCPKMRRWPDILPALTELKIRNCQELNELPRLPSLEELELRNLYNLEEWCDVGGEAHFPHLKSLKIDFCPNMRRRPDILPALTQLKIKNCQGLNELPRLPSLEVLILKDLDNLEEWCDVVGGEAHFPHLKSLKIDGCPKMRRWPSILPALTELRIRYCEGFNELPPLLPSSLSDLSLGGVISERLLNSVSCLTSLLSLDISGIPSPTSMPREILQAQTRLESLTIRGYDRLVTLEDEVLPSTLKSLSFWNCPNLKSLPRTLHALTSLGHLTIGRCPVVASLPEEGLPSSLELLRIWECPVLSERCLKDVGEDWPKISHNPRTLFLTSRLLDALLSSTTILFVMKDHRMSPSLLQMSTSTMRTSPSKILQLGRLHAAMKILQVENVTDVEA